MKQLAHSPIGASSMYRWSRCPGSVKLSATLPAPPSSPYAEEGTRAHEAAAFRLEKGHWPKGIDPEMQEAAQVFTSFVLAKKVRGATLLIEHRFDLSKVYPGLFGTADAVIYDPGKKLLSVIDYKHGAGIPVEVKDNPQLLYYGLGALLSTGFACELIELVIVQPRCPHPEGPIRSQQIHAIELLDFAADLVEFAKRTEDPDAPIVPGEHCRFCPASGVCPALSERALTLAQEEFRSDLSYDPKKLAQILHWLPTLEAWAKQVREFAYGEAEHGRCPPGWKLVEKRATRRWRDEKEAGNSIPALFHLPEDQVFDRKLKSPAQVERLLSKSSKDKLKDLTVSTSSGYTLAVEDDPRPPVKHDPQSEFDRIDIRELAQEVDLLS